MSNEILNIDEKKYQNFISADIVMIPLFINLLYVDMWFKKTEILFRFTKNVNNNNWEKEITKIR